MGICHDEHDLVDSVVLVQVANGCLVLTPLLVGDTFGVRHDEQLIAVAGLEDKYCLAP